MARNMDLEHIIIQIIIFIKEIGNIMLSMAKEHINLPLVEKNILANGIEVKSMGMGYSLLLQVISILVNLSKI